MLASDFLQDDPEINPIVRRRQPRGALGAVEVPRWTNITLPRRPLHPYPYDKDDRSKGGRWIQLIDLPHIPNIYANWPDPGWTAPIQQYIRARVGGVMKALAQWARTAMNVAINQIILHINRVIDTVFRIMDEIGDKLVGGMNRMVGLVNAQFAKLAEDVLREITAVVNTVKSELANARRVIETTAKETRDEINSVMNSAKAEITTAIGTVKTEVVGAAKTELEAARRATIDSITRETAAAKTEITKFIGDLVKTLPKEVAAATAEEFQTRGLAIPKMDGGAAPTSPFPSFFPLGGMGADNILERTAVGMQRYFRRIGFSADRPTSKNVLSSLFGLGGDREIFSITSPFGTMRAWKRETDGLGQYDVPNVGDEPTVEQIADDPDPVYDAEFTRKFLPGSEEYPVGGRGLLGFTDIDNVATLQRVNDGEDDDDETGTG